jgi:ABC-2 type transport system permease protein
MIATVYGITVRTQARRGRLAALVLLGVIGVVVAMAIGLSPDVDHLRAGTNFVNAFGLSLFAPVVTLVFASASLGDPAEDGTLVYLWLRPVARSQIVVGTYLASVSVALPLVVITCGVAAALTGGGADLVAGAVASSTLAVIAYAGVFTWLGLRVRRALVWGLAYILLWEGFVASAGQNAARLAVRAYTRSVLRWFTDIDLKLATVSPFYAVVVPLVVGAVGIVVTTRRLRRTEVA